jgi:hypothetical protein
MSDLPMVEYEDVLYREFYLDINQNSAATFSLD